MLRILLGAGRTVTIAKAPYPQQTKSMSVFLLSLLLCGAATHRMLAQESAKPLSPSEAYKAALAPFTATRNQANDLTDADKLALRIGIAQASRDCLSLSSTISSFAGDAKQLFALGQLCIFGQQFEPAQVALVDYLALPEPAQREQALLLIVRAYLGLKDPLSAEPQVDSLLRDYPYDAPIHGAIDEVIDATEAVNQSSTEVALALCTRQSEATLPLLAKGKGLDGTNGSLSAATLFADAVRCAAVADNSGKPDGLESLAAIADEPVWGGTADWAPMHAALERQRMVRKNVPRLSLRGYRMGTSGLVPSTVSLTRGTVLLVPFTLWSPSTPEVIRDLVQLAPKQAIYAITSWRANTGGADVRTNEVLEGLRSWQKSMPRNVSILIVPDSAMNEFRADNFPIGILIRNGTVLSNAVLSSQGAERLVTDSLAYDSRRP